MATGTGWLCGEDRQHPHCKDSSWAGPQRLPCTSLRFTTLNFSGLWTVSATVLPVSPTASHNLFPLEWQGFSYLFYRWKNRSSAFLLTEISAFGKEALEIPRERRWHFGSCVCAAVGYRAAGTCRALVLLYPVTGT